MATMLREWPGMDRAISHSGRCTLATNLGLVKQLPIHFSRPCIPSCCVARRLNSQLFALLAPCRTGAVTTKMDG